MWGLALSGGLLELGGSPATNQVCVRMWLSLPTQSTWLHSGGDLTKVCSSECGKREIGLRDAATEAATTLLGELPDSAFGMVWMDSWIGNLVGLMCGCSRDWLVVCFAHEDCVEWIGGNVSGLEGLKD